MRISTNLNTAHLRYFDSASNTNFAGRFQQNPRSISTIAHSLENSVFASNHTIAQKLRTLDSEINNLNSNLHLDDGRTFYPEWKALLKKLKELNTIILKYTRSETNKNLIIEAYEILKNKLQNIYDNATLLDILPATEVSDPKWSPKNFVQANSETGSASQTPTEDVNANQISQKLQAIDSNIKNLIRQLQWRIARSPGELSSEWKSIFNEMLKSNASLKRDVLSPSDKAHLNAKFEILAGKMQDIYDGPEGKYLYPNGIESRRRWSPENFANPNLEINILRKKIRTIIEGLDNFYSKLEKPESEGASQRELYLQWMDLHTFSQKSFRAMNKMDSVTQNMRNNFYYSRMRMHYIYTTYPSRIFPNTHLESRWSPESIWTTAPASRALESRQISIRI